MSYSYVEMERAIEIVLRELAKDEGVRLAHAAPVRHSPEEDSLYVPFAVEPARSIHELTIDGELFKADRQVIVDALRFEFANACARARGSAVCDLLDKPVQIDDAKREALCDRFTGLIMRLAGKNHELRECLARKLIDDGPALKR